MVLANPVCVNVQVFRLVLEHSEPGRVPDSAVLFESVNICSEGGKAGGSGGWILLSSRCNSTSELNEAIEDGMEVDNPVEDKSLRTAMLAQPITLTRDKKLTINEVILAVSCSRRNS